MGCNPSVGVVHDRASVLSHSAGASLPGICADAKNLSYHPGESPTMKLRKTYAALACGILFALGAGQSLAAGPAADPKQDAAVVIEQSRGVDPSVDYASLVRFGPWDDRNYELTAADIALLPENDRPVRGVPAFYKVQKRQEMAAEGHPIEKYYPRELDKEFLHRYGGLLQNGKLDRRGLGV